MTITLFGVPQVDVEAPKYPDLVVGSPSVTDNNPQTGGEFHAVGDSEQPRATWAIGGDNVALLPFDGRDDHHV